MKTRIIILLGLGIFSIGNLKGQDIGELNGILNEIKAKVEQQGTVKLKNGKKSGWVFEFKKCKCQYYKMQELSSGTNYMQLDWDISFNLADMEVAQYIEYDNHAVILRVEGEKDLVRTSQTKTYRDYTTSMEKFTENSVYIDVRNRAEIDALVEDFNKAIGLCRANGQ